MIGGEFRDDMNFYIVDKDYILKSIAYPATIGDDTIEELNPDGVILEQYAQDMQVMRNYPERGDGKNHFYMNYKSETLSDSIAKNLYIMLEYTSVGTAHDPEVAMNLLTYRPPGE